MNKHDTGASILQSGLLLIAVFIMALPFIWMTFTSLKPADEVFSYPPAWLPSVPRWQNYPEAWNAAPFARFYLNSLWTASAGAALQLAFAATMAYAFAHIRFPARSALFLAVIATMLVPEETKLAPNFLLVARLGWLDTYRGLIIPGIAHAFPVFVLYQHFRGLPEELFDAARVDGTSHWRMFLHVVLPLSRPVLAAAGVVAFIGRWNDYLWPLVVTNKAAMRTLPVGLGYLKESQDGGTQWNLLMAASIFVIIPVVFLYLAAQRQFIEGLTRGALKN